MSRRPFARVAAIVAASCLLAGCLSVPHSGRVAVDGGNAASAVRNLRPEVRVDAAPPAPGEAPKQIVADFYNAMVDYNNDYAVAKMYLLQGSSGLWNRAPTRAAVVLDVPDPAVVPGSGTATSTSFTMHFAKVAEVLADNEFVAGRQSTDIVTDTLRVVKDPKSGEWRIASGAPDALRLSIADFDTVYHEATLYFPGAGKDSVPVADRRWFAARRAELPKAVARAYVEGPSFFLAAGQSVSPLLSVGAAAVDAHPTAPGDVALAFTGVTDGVQESLIKSLLMTFQPESSDFNQLVVGINGVETKRALVPAPPETALPLTVQNSWFIDAKHVLRPYADAGTPTAEGGLPPRFDVKGMTAVSLSPDALFAAGGVRATDGTYSLRIVPLNTAPRNEALQASSLASVTWSADGRGLWVAGAVKGTPTLWFVGITLVGEGRAAQAFVTTQEVAIDPELTRDGRTLLDVRPSPDGVRMSAIVQEPGATKQSVLYVGRIDLTQTTPAVASFRRVAPVLTVPVPVKNKPSTIDTFTVARARWTDAETLVIVASRGGGEYQVSTATVDGSEFTAKNAADGPTLGPSTEVAVAKNANILALDSQPKTRQLYALTDTGWGQIKRQDKAAVVAVMYPG